MDGSTFDRLTRAVTTAGSRRRLLGVLTSLGLSGLLTHLDDETTEAKRQHGRNRGHHPGKHKRKRKGKRKGHGGGVGGSGPCTANGGACQQGSDCCGGNCFGQVCSATVSTCGTMDCPSGATGCCAEGCCEAPANQCNAAELCCAPNCDGRECGPDGCGNSGECGSCASGQTCNDVTGRCEGQAVCDVCPTCTYTTVQAAVADSGGPTTIRICPGAYTETITIGRALTLIGAGQGTGAGDTVLHGAGSSVVTINAGVGAVTLQGLRITGGSSDNGAGVWHQGATLTMTGCTITDNHAAGNIANGGGLQNATGAMTLTNCTVSGNSANADTTPLENAQGGGIANLGETLLLNNTSVTGNDTNGSGGGIFNEGVALLQNGSSVTGNTPDNCGGPNTVPGCSG